MPQDSALFGVARIRCHEKDLLGKDRMRRMTEGSIDEVMRILHDAGYGSMPDAGAEQADDMISNELRAAYTLVREVTFEEKLTDLFLMKADVNNLKLLLKLRLTGSGEKPALMEGGRYDTEKLAAMVQESKYSDLPEEFQSALGALEREFQSGVDPAKLSISLDKAYIAYALRVGGSFAVPFFKAQADFANILAMLRIRASGAGAGKLKEALLPEGAVSHLRLMEALEAPQDSLPKLLAAGDAYFAIKKGLEEYLRSGSLSALERERDNYIISLASKGKYQDDIAPVVGYLMAREQEAKCVRLIITAKRNGLSDSVIAERLRELYG